MMRYCPEPSVTTVRDFSFSTGLDASTVTPGSTAPDASLIVPAICAPICADATAGTSRSNNAKVTRDFATTRMLSHSPSIPSGAHSARGDGFTAYWDVRHG